MSAEAKVTPWFPADVKPVRPGVYERDMESVGLRGYGQWSHWDGERWGGYGADKKIAMRNAESPSAYQSIPWRGLARKP